MTSPYAFAENFKNIFDFNQIFSTQRRNIEALSAANQVVVEGFQAAFRRQAEVQRDNVEEALKASRTMFQAGSPENSLTRQAECARTILENNFNTLREVTETITKSSFEAFDVLNKRATESLEEINKASSSPAPRARKSA
jgi:phasin family protein